MFFQNHQNSSTFLLFFCYNCILILDNTVDPLCETQEDSDIYMVIFCVAQFFNAMGGVTLQVVAIPMLDENIKSKQLPLYQGK